MSNEKSILSTDEVLQILHQNTVEKHRNLWTENIRLNRELMGFKPTINELKKAEEDRKAVVVAAGPTMKEKHTEDLKTILDSDVVVLSCDGALPVMRSLGDYTPDYLVSVDGSPIVAKFYRGQRLDGCKVILMTSIHPDVTTEALDSGAEVYWMQGFGDESPDFHVEGVPVTTTGGNVGTTSWIIGSILLKCRPIGLLGLEFSWSDEVPLTDTQYYQELHEIFEGDEEKIEKHFVRVTNPRDGKTYLADPVYYAYSLAFRQLFQRAPALLRHYTYNLTEEGILDVPGMLQVSPGGFLEI